MRIRVFVLVIISCIATPFVILESFGHGLGSETLPPIMLGNRNVTLSISESQLTPDSSQSSKLIAIMLYETNTKKSVHDVTFHVTASRYGTVLFEHTFQRNSGDLDLNIITTNQDKLEVKEEYGADWLGQIVGSQSNFAIITGPIFGTGGLYNFKIDVLTADSYSNKPNPSITYDVGISIPDTNSYTVTDTNGNDQKINIITYYDQISNFEYTAQNTTIRFKMPFDWSEANISQVAVVHEEIQIPKSFGDMLSPKYLGYVNGITLDDRSIIVDDYSTPDRLIHIIVNQNDLQKLRQKITGDDIEFVLQPSVENAPLLTHTKNSQYSVALQYTPHPLLAGSDASFSFEIRDQQNKTMSVRYDFRVLQSNVELFKKHVADANLENKVNMSMPSAASGPILIRLDNIGGNEYATAEFPLVVGVQNQAQTFPIEMFSFSSRGDPKSLGAYQVDLTWFPSTLQIDEDSEFIFTIRDVKSGEPVSNTYYEFVILQDGNEVFRKPGFTSSGGDYVDYSFAKGQEGTYTIRIENIGNTTQLAETIVTVTPEFPIGLTIVLLLSFVILLVLNHAMRGRWNLKHNGLVM